MAQLEHPHVVPLYDYWREPDAAYLVMRFLRGGSLRAGSSEQGPLEPTRRLGSSIRSPPRSPRPTGRDRPPRCEAGERPARRGRQRLPVGLRGRDRPRRASDRHTWRPRQPRTCRPSRCGSSPSRGDRRLRARGRALRDAHRRAPVPRMLLELAARTAPVAPLPSIVGLRPDLPAAVDVIVARATRCRSGRALRRSARRRYRLPRGDQLARGGSGAVACRGDEPLQGTGGVRRARCRRLLRTRTHGGAADRPHGRGHTRVEVAGRRRAVGIGQVVARARWVAAGTATRRARRLRVMVRDRARARRSPVRRTPGRTPPRRDRVASGPRRHARGGRRWAGARGGRILPQDDETELVLVVDQLEELFTLTTSARERAAFLAALATAATDPGSRLRIVATLRADFYDRPLSDPRASDRSLAARTEAIVPLSPDELERAIEGPAERVGVSLGPALVAEIRGRRRRPARCAAAPGVRAHRAVRPPRRPDDDAGGLSEGRRRDRCARPARRGAVRHPRRRRTRRMPAAVPPARHHRRGHREHASPGRALRARQPRGGSWPDGRR